MNELQRLSEIDKKKLIPFKTVLFIPDARAFCVVLRNTVMNVALGILDWEEGDSLLEYFTGKTQEGLEVIIIPEDRQELLKPAIERAIAEDLVDKL